MYPESEFQQLSALQHLAFCPRQWALIHLEGCWEENMLTAEGKILHDRAHEGEEEMRGDCRIVRGLRLHSFRLGLSGMADVVEFYREGDDWRPYPVEYKHGRPKLEPCDEIQLCAQALCLEEMLNRPVEKGAIYYGKPRRRKEIVFGDELRNQTESFCTKLHQMSAAGKTPAAEYRKECEGCSLLVRCLPKVTSKAKSTVRHYIVKMLAE